MGLQEVLRVVHLPHSLQGQRGAKKIQSKAYSVTHPDGQRSVVIRHRHILGQIEFEDGYNQIVIRIRPRVENNVKANTIQFILPRTLGKPDPPPTGRPRPRAPHARRQR
jgi:hypothetical protein